MVDLCRVGSKMGFVVISKVPFLIHCTIMVTGGIIHISLMGQPIILVNSADIMDAFDKAGAIYSDRPILPMGGELVGYRETLVLLRYGTRFRTSRKQFSRFVGANKPVQALRPMIEQETRRFLKRVIANHENLSGHLRK